MSSPLYNVRRQSPGRGTMKKSVTPFGFRDRCRWKFSSSAAHAFCTVPPFCKNAEGGMMMAARSCTNSVAACIDKYTTRRLCQGFTICCGWFRNCLKPHFRYGLHLMSNTYLSFWFAVFGFVFGYWMCFSGHSKIAYSRCLMFSR